MNKKTLITFVLILMYICGMAQSNVIKEPQTKTHEFTGYFIERKTGEKDSLFMSKNGKYFTKRISQKTGNQYYKYHQIELPKKK
jgi:hypothetical protein